MSKTYVYLIGGSLDSLDLADRKQIVKMGLNLEGYCDLGWAEGYAIYGTLPKLKKFVEDYIGVEIVEDYLFEEDVFEDMADDGDWKHVDFQSWELLNTFKKSFGESKKVSRKSIKESQEYNFDYFYQLLKDDKHFSVNYAHDDLPDDDTVYANGNVDVKWFIDGKRLNNSAILPISCFSMVFTHKGLLFNCEHGNRYDSVIGYADISDVRFRSDILSLLLVNGLRITFELW